MQADVEEIDFSGMKDMKDALNDNKNFSIGRNLEGDGEAIDLSKIKDLGNEDELFAQMNEEGNIVMDQGDRK